MNKLNLLQLFFIFILSFFLLGRLSMAQENREIIRNLAHEVKNPLGALRGAAQLLQKELNNADLDEYTDVIISEADRLQAMVDNLLTSHKLPTLTYFHVHQVLEHITRLMHVEFAHKIVIQKDYDFSLPELYGDKEQIVQALLNITRNAAQAISGEGSIRFRTRVARHVTLAKKIHKLAVLIQIIDEGPGIPEDQQERIFFPLVTDREGGTGLGLSIAQTYINYNKGKIEVESNAEQTCFSIILPVGQSTK